MHEPLRQRIAVQYHLDGLSREELDAYLTHQLKAAGVTQPLLDETARATTDSSGTQSMRLLRNRNGFQPLSRTDNTV
jgi:hypothetical protein